MNTNFLLHGSVIILLCMSNVMDTIYFIIFFAQSTKMKCRFFLYERINDTVVNFTVHKLSTSQPLK